MVNRMEHAAIFLVYNLEDYMQTLLPAARCAVHGKLGQMWTDFEPKRGKSARMLGIENWLSEHVALEVVCGTFALEMGGRMRQH